MFQKNSFTGDLEDSDDDGVAACGRRQQWVKGEAVTGDSRGGWMCTGRLWVWKEDDER